MSYIMCNEITFRPKWSNLLLLIIRSIDTINKSLVIKAISWAYDIMGKKNLIFMTVHSKTVANNISWGTLHTEVGIDTWKQKKTAKNQ